MAVKRARRDLALASGIALLAALPHLAAGLSASFIFFDDPEYVTANPQVLQGLGAAGVRWALTTLQFPYWHPLTWLSHMLDVTLFGLDARGHHATSVLLHALNAGLLFLVLRRMTGAVGRSAFVAAVFGVHPLHVEPASWVAMRKDVLSALFFMLVLLAWERYARRRGAWRYLVALALFAAGLAAKPMLVTVPFILLLLDFWPLGRAPRGGQGTGAQRWGTLVLEKIPFLALAAASSVLTVLGQRAAGALPDMQHLSLGARLANAVVSCATYLVTALWPARLAVLYPYPTAVAWPTLAVSVAFLALVSLAAFRRPLGRPAAAVGWCWFVGMLVPVIGLVQAGVQARADRYTYLPLIGVFVAVAWLAAGGLGPSLRQPRALGPLAGAVIAACVAASTVQAGYWRDSETLFVHALAVTRDNRVIQSNLAGVLTQNGRHEEAVAHAREAIRLKPDYADAHYVLGNALAALGRYGEAAAEYRDVVRLRPGTVEAHYNLGSSLAVLGRHEEAAAEYREAIRLGPGFADVSFNLGNSLVALGRIAEAAAEYREAIRLRPAFAGAHTNLGLSLAILGRPEEAVQHLREAVRLRPEDAEARYNLGNCLAALGRPEEAAASLREALRLAPGHAAARERLARLTAAEER